LMVVSFHWTTSLATASGATAKIERQATTTVPAATPMTRARCIMGSPPCDGPFTSTTLPVPSRVLDFPVVSSVDQGLEGRPILEQRRLDGGLQILVESRVVERHLVLAHRA